MAHGSLALAFKFIDGGKHIVEVDDPYNPGEKTPVKVYRDEVLLLVEGQEERRTVIDVDLATANADHHGVQAFRQSRSEEELAKLVLEAIREALAKPADPAPAPAPVPVDADVSADGEVK
jgi:hypothetical protein